MKILFISSAGISCLLIAAIWCSAGENVVAADAPARTGGVSGKTASDSESSARKIYIDPATGQKTPPPADQVQPPIVLPGVTSRTSTTSEGLIETPVTEKPGGFKVHLNGKFHANVTVTNCADGKAAAQCVAGPEEILKSRLAGQSTGALPKKSR